MEINQSQLMSPETQQAYARACELIETRRYDGAVEALRNLLSVCPGHAGAQNDIGVLYSQRGEPKLALQHLTTALRLDPFNVGTMKNVADVCATVGACLVWAETTSCAAQGLGCGTRSGAAACECPAWAGGTGARAS